MHTDNRNGLNMVEFVYLCVQIRVFLCVHVCVCVTITLKEKTGYQLESVWGIEGGELEGEKGRKMM